MYSNVLITAHYTALLIWLDLIFMLWSTLSWQDMHHIQYRTCLLVSRPATPTAGYEWEQRALVRKTGLYRSLLCCLNTADLGAFAGTLQSPTEVCAYFLCPLLDHMEHEGHRDTVYHRVVPVRVFTKWAKSARQCLRLWRQGALIFVSICIFLLANEYFY